MKQRGVALLGILLVVSLVTILAVSIAHSNMVRLGLAERRIEAAQAWRIWSGGVEWARDILREDRRRDKFVDHPGEFWARGIQDYQAEGGVLSGLMVDQQGLFNLNNLVRAGEASQTDMDLFRRLLRELGLDESLAETLTDWVDPDRAPLPGGAEDNYYARMDPPYRAANAPLRHLSELYRVRGFNAATIERLRPFVTVLPSGSAINVNSASETLLVAMLPDVEPGLIAALVEQRESEPFQSMTAFQQALPSGASVNFNRLAVMSQYFLLRMSVRYGQARAEGEALLYRNVGLPSVIWRSRGLGQPMKIDNPVNLDEEVMVKR